MQAQERPCPRHRPPLQDGLLESVRRASRYAQDTPAGLDDDAQHRPQVGQRSEQTDRTELGEIGVGIGMVEPELAAVVVQSWAPLLQQHASARVVELAVMEDDQAGIADQIGPHVVVTGRVAELIDDEIVGTLAVLPDEVVCAEQPYTRIRRHELFRPPVDEQIDIVRHPQADGSSSPLYCEMPDLSGRRGAKKARRGIVLGRDFKGL